MCNMSQIIDFLKNNPGATAQEIGVTPVEMSRLAAKGIVEKVGTRSTGTRGRPPVEWALPGADLTQREDVSVFKAPALPVVDPKVRKAMDAESLRQIEYIEGEWEGKHGVREMADYNLLRGRYADIVRAAAKRVNAPMPVIDFNDDQEDENDG